MANGAILFDRYLTWESNSKMQLTMPRVRMGAYDRFTEKGVVQHLSPQERARMRMKVL